MKEHDEARREAVEPRRRSTLSPRSGLFTARQRRGPLARSLSPIPLSLYGSALVPVAPLSPFNFILLRSFALRYGLSFFSTILVSLSLSRSPFASSSSIRSLSRNLPSLSFNPSHSIPRLFFDLSSFLYGTLSASLSFRCEPVRSIFHFSTST